MGRARTPRGAVKLFESPLRSVRVAALLAAGLAALASANTLGNGFAYDDTHIVVENTAIQSLETLPGALIEPYWPGAFAREHGLWRPTTTALLGLEYALVGRDPTLYHLVNVLGNAVAAALVVLVLAHLTTLAAAFAAGLVFAVHPVHVEAVANVVGIAEILPAVLFLWAALVHLRGGERTRWRTGLGIAALYGLAFGAKESAVTLPGVLFLLDAARERLAFADLSAYLRRRWRLYAPMAVVAAGMLLARRPILGGVADAFPPTGADLLTEIPRIWTLAEVWSHYVRLLVFPMDLSADYAPDVLPISLGWHTANLVGLVLALAVLAGALAAWRRPPMAPGRSTGRAVGFGVVWFLVTISPVSNVFFLTGVVLAERTLYLPSVGFAAAFGWLAVRLARERRFGAVALVAVTVALMGWRTWERNPTWRDNEAVFGHLIADYPHSGRSQWVLGTLFFEHGDPRQALVSYRAAVGLLGTHYPLMMEIAEKLTLRDDYEPATRLLEYAWREYPEIVAAPNMLALLYADRDMPEESERWARIAGAAEPEHPLPPQLLARALAEQQRWREAAEAREAAIERGLGASWTQWASLAELRSRAGDSALAWAALDSARALAVPGPARRHVDSLRAAWEGEAGIAPGPVPRTEGAGRETQGSERTKRDPGA